ncbi:hypothetical protein TVAG_208330 [Trichomonas vaginalis G3]|uniref:receptor protein-tyrosine kinase n=1 Tax=Trichomonas vaginalis (strain ATCC PRA-98 / G3) TaxID=412133 RepID=A2G536_TRIV3|nr:glycine-rich protein family [Trichomonas vaginalis G3]EAX87729.1 hypothetical protein TVAG_208330 [Trichomonas vaginalis G3]KAI5531886.1 glycine-rich protein family [Trichomonas vaginalis G3]|eukprot:XP_001300659.1 hypothetical protein [Trichomonas vaginalis G3]
MVAASGGSIEWLISTPTPAGGLFSIDSNSSLRDTGSYIFTVYGANQTHAGYGYNENCVQGTFGIAGYIVNDNVDWGAIGGNGYYAGCSTSNSGGSTGGSSFISGHPGCDAISNESSSFENIIHTGQPIHYSNISFFNTKMIDGQNKIPVPWSHYDEINETGHNGNGFVRITVLDEAIVLTCKPINSLSSINILPHLVFISLSS